MDKWIWTGSFIENPDVVDYTYEVREDEVVILENGYQVEGAWEANGYSASAAFICRNGGDILQIGHHGFDQMSKYIQTHDIKSHTIIIDRTQALPYAEEWAKNKSNVNIITGSFYEKKLAKYDGIFVNKTKMMYCNKETVKQELPKRLKELSKSLTLVSWFNHFNWPGNILGEAVDYECIELSDYPPTHHKYFEGNKYFLPKMAINE